MGKEIKIGLGIIGGLLCVFGGVLFMRLKKEQPLLAEAKAVVEKVEAKLKPKEEGKADKIEKSNNRKPASDSALAKRPGPSRREKPAGPALDRYGRPGDDEPQAATDPQVDPSANQTEPPELDKSPYRKRLSDDRYARYSTDQDTAAEPEEPAAATGESEQTNDDVALPADRFSLGGAGLALSPADDSGEMPANEGELPVDDQAAPEATTPTDEQVADDAQSPSRYNDEQAMFPGRAVAEEALADNTEPPANEPQETAEAPRPAAEADSYTADSYTVEPNDNFWRISQKMYGTGAYFKALEEYNRQRFGDQVVIHAGDVISAPSLDVLRAKFPSLVPGGRNLPAARRPPRGRRSYTVAAGDTLFDIARHELGKASRWSEIYDLNRDQLGNDFNDLTPGMKLALPDGGGQAEPVIGGSQGDRYRR